MQAEIAKIKAELEELKVNSRPVIAERLRAAREQGDLSENAEYEAAREDQLKLEAHIRALENLLSDLKRQDKESRANEKERVQEQIIGHTVRFLDPEMGTEVEYTIVKTYEVDPAHSLERISNICPFGQELAKALKDSEDIVGKSLNVKAPGGVFRYLITGYC